MIDLRRKFARARVPANQGALSERSLCGVCRVVVVVFQGFSMKLRQTQNALGSLRGE